MLSLSRSRRRDTGKAVRGVTGNYGPIAATVKRAQVGCAGWARFCCKCRRAQGAISDCKRQIAACRLSHRAMAVDLWLDYKENGSRRALKTLLRYNAEDVTNLAHIRRKLGVR